MRLLAVGYIIMYVHILFHELGHYFFAKMLLLKVVRVKIGNSMGQLSVGEISISPIIGGGYVEIEQEEIESKSKIEVFLFFIAGIVAHVVLLILGKMIFNSLYAILNNLVGISMIVVNCIPFFEESDISNMIRVLKKSE